MTDKICRNCSHFIRDYPQLGSHTCRLKSLQLPPLPRIDLTNIQPGDVFMHEQGVGVGEGCTCEDFLEN